MTELMPQDIMHYDARSLKKAIALLHNNYGKAKVISGGVDVVHLIKSEVLLPNVLVNIKNIPGISAIKQREGQLSLGSLVKLSEIEKSTLINRKFPLLARAARSIASPQIRNMSTVAGNLCQHVWCQYYRRSPDSGTTFDCLRKGGKKCFAVTGNNAEHAIIGRGKCMAICPSDLATALAALSANLVITGGQSSRILPVSGFYTDMGNVLKHDELITSISVPAPHKDARQYFSKFRLRKSIDFALASVASVIRIEYGLVIECSIVLGGIAPMPYRAIAAEEYILGKEITSALAEEAANNALESASPLKMNAYKVPIAQALIKRAILNAQD